MYVCVFVYLLLIEWWLPVRRNFHDLRRERRRCYCRWLCTFYVVKRRKPKWQQKKNPKIIKWIHSQSEQTKQIIYRWLPIFDFAFSKQSSKCQTRRFACDCFSLLYFCECACSIASESVTIMSECVWKAVDTTVRTTTIHHAGCKGMRKFINLDQTRVRRNRNGENWKCDRMEYKL